MQKKKKQQHKRKQIPESLGNRDGGVWLYSLALAFNALMHAALFTLYGFTFYNFVRLSISLIFFIYPFNYVADVLWSMRPSVCGILAGETLINRKYYMNTPRIGIEHQALLPVTISIPVYTEDNEVIFETVSQSLAAANRYRECSSQPAEVVVSDDGIAPMLGGNCSREKADSLAYSLVYAPQQLSALEIKAAERICFYREKGISFVVRPAKDRPGLFKKASNLNYTLRLGEALAQGIAMESLIQADGAFAGGYAEGDITTNEIILLLDKDSGVKERIIEAIIPEFIADDRLAYVQCATNAVNMFENFYTFATGHQINNLFLNIWPCKALQGFFVPLVGHNVFLRKSILEKTGLWSENRVSEDYDKAISFYNMGYHGKYAQLKGLEFTEYVSRTFVEETGKQLRYAYGLLEMVFEGTLIPKKTRRCDILYMLLYFFSIVNQIMLIPTVLIECYFGDIHLLWLGFFVCNVCFIVLPCIRGLFMRRRLAKEKTEKILHTVLIAVSFVGHSFSMLAGACRYLGNKIKSNRKPFPSTSVDKLDYRFWGGVKLITEFIRKNKGFIPIAILCLDRGMFMITRKGIEPATVIAYSYILFGTVLTPILLTPQLFAKRRTVFAGSQKYQPVSIVSASPVKWSGNMQTVPDHQSPREELSNAEINSFLDNYQEIVLETISCEGMPEELTRDYSFESCIRKDAKSKKELYLLRSRKDGRKAILRITKDYPEEDALEEAILLSALNHPGIPKLYASYEHDGKNYIIREYIEGHSLHDIVKNNGVLSVKDVFGVMLKLADILGYLHAQRPPVIHRDIKPQNIIVGRDGSIHLIDFGIARIHKEGRKQDTSIVLTLDYAPPEQYGFDQTSPLTDIYSSGVVMLFMATGKVTKSGLEAQIVNNQLRNLIERCIAFDPISRIQSVNEIRNYILRENNLRKQGRSMAIAAGVAASFVCLSSVSYFVGAYGGKAAGTEAGYNQGYGIGYTDGYEDAPVFQTLAVTADSPPGNLPGNMAVPGGAFATMGEDLVFYIMDGDLYQMSESGADSELLLKVGNANGLCYNNGWLYYSSGSQMLQTNIYTLKSDVLSEDLPGKLHLVDGKYYIASEEGLYQMNMPTGNITQLNSLQPSESLNISGKTMVFAYGKSRTLSQAGLRGDQFVPLAEGTCESICLYGGDIYAAVRREGSGELLRITPATGEQTVLTEVSANMINVTGKGIYYLDSIDGSINLCSADGRIKSKISANSAVDFNIAGDWIFYHNEQDSGKLWCVRTDGTNDHQVRTRR